MFRDEFIPSEENHSYEFPKELFGKKIIITSNTDEIKNTNKTIGDLNAPTGKYFDFWKDLPVNVDFPTQNEIRAQNWEDKWKK